MKCTHFLLLTGAVSSASTGLRAPEGGLSCCRQRFFTVALGSVTPLGTSLGSEPYIEGSNIPLGDVMLFKYKRKKKSLSFSLVYVFEQLKQWMAAVLDVA